MTTVIVRLLDLPALGVLIKPPPCRLQALDVFIFLHCPLLFPGRDRWGWVGRVKTMDKSCRMTANACDHLIVYRFDWTAERANPATKSDRSRDKATRRSKQTKLLKRRKHEIKERFFYFFKISQPSSNLYLYIYMNRDAKGVPSMSDLALSPAPNEVGGKLIKGPLFLRFHNTLVRGGLSAHHEQVPFKC